MRMHLLLLTFSVAIIGCADSVVNVSGKVTLDKKALANATVLFEPAPDQTGLGAGAHGKTDANGEYSLSLMTKETKGAAPGKYIVKISAYDGDPGDNSDSTKVPKQLVPERYNIKTKLTFDVPAAGTTSANFDLEK
ncbi:MAG: carboxypeptidase-like regulatory domain-containing protein [Planctomycetes bacterium]|nr:carboxypeptidase-like regulatory domain-containing protein [Planctomycetota bacterium]